MTLLTIRDLLPGDVDAYIELTQTAFAEEMQLEGQTPAMAAQSIRRLAMGNAVPFRMLMWLARLNYAVQVAEQAGQVVGACALTGMKHRHALALHSLMVAPASRRQGVATALTQACLARAQQLNAKLVYTTVLEHNQASLGNMRKCGFTPYHTSTEVELSLPLPASQSIQAAVKNSVRVLRAADREALNAFEEKAVGAVRLQIEGSAADFVYPNVMQQLFQQLLLRRRSQTWVVEHAGQINLLARGRTDAHRSTGLLSVEMLPAAEDAVATVLAEAAHWFTALGKTSLRITFSQAVRIPADLPRHVGWVHLYWRAPNN